MENKFNIVVVLGPTASGKTKLACQIANDLNGEIISADSRQVYTQMDIGTGKDLDEYFVDGKPIPYHLIDIKEPGYKYNIAEFQIDFITAFNEVSSRAQLPILCGGSGLYIETALRGNSHLGIPANESVWTSFKLKSDEELELAYNQIPESIRLKLNALTRPRKIRAIEIAFFLTENPNWKPIKLPELHPLIIGVDIERELRRSKITKRLSERMNNGLIEEVEGLLKGTVTFEDLEYYGLEYKWIGKFLKKEIKKRELFDGLNIAIHQFAKRQMTWYRRMEKNGYDIRWMDANLSITEKMKQIKNWL